MKWKRASCRRLVRVESERSPVATTPPTRCLRKITSVDSSLRNDVADNPDSLTKEELPQALETPGAEKEFITESHKEAQSPSDELMRQEGITALFQIDGPFTKVTNHNERVEGTQPPDCNQGLPSPSHQDAVTSIFLTPPHPKSNISHETPPIKSQTQSTQKARKPPSTPVTSRASYSQHFSDHIPSRFDAVNQVTRAQPLLRPYVNTRPYITNQLPPNFPMRFHGDPYHFYNRRPLGPQAHYMPPRCTPANDQGYGYAYAHAPPPSLLNHPLGKRKQMEVQFERTLSQHPFALSDSDSHPRHTPVKDQSKF